MSGYTDDVPAFHGISSPGIAFIQKPLGADRAGSRDVWVPILTQIIICAWFGPLCITRHVIRTVIPRNWQIEWTLLLPLPLFLAMSWLYAQTANRIMPLTEREAVRIATDAYIYGYPLVTTRITGLAFTNTAAPNPATMQAPINQIVNQPDYPPANYHGVTTSNADTLYSLAFLDLSRGPMVLSYPEMGNRYFLFPIYDAWTNVIDSPGTRTTEGAAQKIVIAGTSWHGATPAGTKLVRAPGNLAFVIGRVYSDGTASDMAAVHALQAQFKLTPLSSYGKAYTPPAGQTGGPYTPREVVRNVIAGMSASEYFNFLAEAMKENPPVLPQDAPIVASMSRIGLVPGKPFDMSQLSPPIQKALQEVPKTVNAEFEKSPVQGLGKEVNGWVIPASAGKFGADYRARAIVSDFGWGANLPEDAVYLMAKADDSGRTLNGAQTYVLHFAKGEMPPVRGFWSLTMYGKDYYFYPNALHKLTLSERNRLQYNADGSLDLYFSHQKPANVPQANWLPAPADDFILALRMYWPRTAAPSILPPENPTWVPPGVKARS